MSDEDDFSLDELYKKAAADPDGKKISVESEREVMGRTLAAFLLPVIVISFLLFIALGPQELPPYKENLLANIEGLLAALVFYWLGGNLVGRMDLTNNWARLGLQFGSAIGAFLVMWILASPYSPFNRAALPTTNVNNQPSAIQQSTQPPAQ